MQLFLVQKIEACDKYAAQYIVQAATESEALEKVNLSPDAIQEMNEPYREEPFPRYMAVVEEIEFNSDGFYLIY